MEILSYRAVNKGLLLGFFNVRIPRWDNAVLKNLRLLSKNNHRFIGFPAKEMMIQGEKKFSAQVVIEDKETFFKLQNEILKAIDEWMLKNSSQPPISNAQEHCLLDQGERENDQEVPF